MLFVQAFAYPKYAYSPLTIEVNSSSSPDSRTKLLTRVKSLRFTFTTMPGSVKVLSKEGGQVDQELVSMTSYVTVYLYRAFADPKYAWLSLTTDVNSLSSAEFRTRLSTRVKSERFNFTTIPGLLSGLAVLCRKFSFPHKLPHKQLESMASYITMHFSRAFCLPEICIVSSHNGCS